MPGIELIQAENLAGQAGIRHGFTTRKGGVSQGPYAGLNLTRSRGDHAGNVTENRRLLADHLGLDQLAFAAQIHGRDVIEVSAPPKGEKPVGEADALITDRPGIGLVCQTADCTPLLIYDPENKAVAAVHSGWRGTVKNVVGATVEALGRAYGSRPEALLAAIGPSVGAENYRVGPEVLDAFEQVFGPLEGRFISERDQEGGAPLDVALGAQIQLIEAGLPERQIWRAPHCTYADEARFFSARRSHHRGETGQFGGQGGVIALV